MSDPADPTSSRNLPTEPEPVNDRTEARIRETYARAENQSRATLASAWECGGYLRHAHETADRREGGFRGVLKRTRVPARTAYRWIRLARGFPEQRQLSGFLSINAALDALDALDRSVPRGTLPKPAKQPAPADDPESATEPEPIPTAATVVQDDPDAHPEPATEPEPTPRRRPPMRDRLADATTRIEHQGGEIQGLQRRVADLERQIRLLQDAARPDAAARLQELQFCQQESEERLGQAQHWQQRYAEEQRRCRHYLRTLQRHNLADGRGRVTG